MIKILQLWQPWASLMAHQEKLIETRHWHTPYRGEVAIYATNTWNSDVRDMCEASLVRESLGFGKIDKPLRDLLPFGKIISVGRLADCRPTQSVIHAQIFDWYPRLDTEKERAFGNYEPGRFGLLFTDMRALTIPIPFKGRQALLLDCPAEIEQWIRRQVPAVANVG